MEPNAALEPLIYSANISVDLRLHGTATAPLLWTAFLPWGKMGTEPNEHGTPSMAPTQSMAPAPAPSHVNAPIGNSTTAPATSTAIVPCRVNDA